VKSVARFVQVCCVNVQKVFYTGCFYTGCFTWGVLYRVFLYRMFYMGCLYSVLYRVFYMECFTWGVLYRVFLHRVFYMGCFIQSVLYRVFIRGVFTSGTSRRYRYCMATDDDAPSAAVSFASKKEHSLCMVMFTMSSCQIPNAFLESPITSPHKIES